MTAASWYANTDGYAPPLPGAASETGAQKEACSVNLDTSRHRLLPGTRVGDHLIVRGVLGEGGTAVVYEALHTRLGASVALKVVDVCEEYMEGARARLLREAQVCASLEDAHIPRIYDVGELSDGTPFVVMERVSGRTLENVLSAGPLPLDVAVHIAEDLLLAVESIEKAGIVHRDIKPPNIILQTSGEGMLRVRLMDFGVSKNVNTDRDPSMMSNPGLTQHGAIVGTPHYMAPEQIVGPSVDTRADLYAVGVVAYEMIGGRTPFEGQTTSDVVAAVLHTRPLPLRKLRDVHPEIEAWVEQAMAPRRTDRFPSARVMRECLRDAWAEHLAYVTASGRRSWARRARYVGALGLVAVGVALPLPAGYDVNSLSQLLGISTPAAPATAAAAAGATVPAAPAEAAPTQAADLGGSAPAAAILPPPTWNMGKPSDWKASEMAAAEPQAAEPTPTSLPQAEPLRASADAEAERAAAPARAAAVAPTMGFGARRRLVVADASVSGPVPGRAEPHDTAEAEPRRGVLLDEYLRQLESKLQAPLPAAAEPAHEPSKRVPGQLAPNPFDSNLPDNPYDGQ